jgi:hypothetical protein
MQLIILEIYLDTTGAEYEQHCCYGYCIDLLQELSKNLSFVFTLHLVADGKYGSFEKVNNTQWISQQRCSCFYCIKESQLI